MTDPERLRPTCPACGHYDIVPYLSPWVVDGEWALCANCAWDGSAAELAIGRPVRVEARTDPCAFRFQP